MHSVIQILGFRCGNSPRTGDSPSPSSSPSHSAFSVIYAVLLDPYPYKDTHRMVHVELLDRQNREIGLVFVNGDEYRELLQLKTLDDVFLMSGQQQTIVTSCRSGPAIRGIT